MKLVLLAVVIVIGVAMAAPQPDPKALVLISAEARHPPPPHPPCGCHKSGEGSHECHCHDHPHKPNPHCGCGNVLNTCVEALCKCHGDVKPYKNLDEAVKDILMNKLTIFGNAPVCQSVWASVAKELAPLKKLVINGPHYGSLKAFLNQIDCGKLGDILHMIWPHVYPQRCGCEIKWEVDICYEKSWVDYYAPSYTCDIVDSDCKDHNIARFIRVFIRNLFHRPLERLENKCLQKIVILQKKWSKLVSKTEEIDKECNFLACVSNFSWQSVQQQISSFVQNKAHICAQLCNSDVCEKLKCELTEIAKKHKKQLIEWWYCRFLPTKNAQHLVNVLGSCLFREIIRGIGKSAEWEQWLVHGYRRGICWDQLWPIVLHSECWHE